VTLLTAACEHSITVANSAIALRQLRQEGWRTQIGSKRTLQIKLRNGLTSSRVLTTFAVHARGSYAPSRLNFHPYGWAAGPCQTQNPDCECKGEATSFRPSTKCACPEASDTSFVTEQDYLWVIAADATDVSLGDFTPTTTSSHQFIPLQTASMDVSHKLVQYRLTLVERKEVLHRGFP
jgi:hypothetical protein